MFDHCIYFNTAALARQLERIWAKAFQPFELTAPQAFLLRAVLDRPGMLQSELADALKVARPTATRSLDGLEARRLVERRATKRDGRECEIFPTPDALPLKAPLNEASGEVTKRLKAILGEAAFASFVQQAKAIAGKTA
ncbi:MAG: MarR family winged helix-turn-helix transcriptional regulator [Rhizobiaceae bacterium]